MSKADLYQLGLKPQYTFQSFIVGPHNQMAAAACQEVTKKPGEAYNPLVIFGTPGIGKTHLIQAVAHETIQNNPKLSLKYISAERFASEVIAAISDDNVMAVRQHYSDLDLFVIDDIQFLAESKASQSEFFHIFNNLHEKNRQVIMAADRPPNQLTMLDQAIRSRIEWGLAVDVKVPELETRVQILKTKQEVQGLNLDAQTIAFAAQHLQSNVRELEGFLKRLHAYVALSRMELNMGLVQQVIREIAPAGSQFQATSMTSTPIPSSPGMPTTPWSNTPPPPNPIEVASQIARPVEAPPPAPPPAPPQPPTVSLSESAGIRIEPKKPTPVQPAPVSALPPPAPPQPAPPPPPVPASAPPPPSRPTSHIVPPAAPDLSSADEEAANNHKEIGAVFFYPEGKEKELESVHKKFQDVIKKHKLKFRLKRVFSHGYGCKGKINYTAFVDVCKVNKVPVAIVIGPPPDALLPEQDFYDLLSVTLDVQGVSLQLVNWAEVEKDYRYLNLALDIALVRSR